MRKVEPRALPPVLAHFRIYYKIPLILVAYRLYISVRDLYFT